MRLGVLIRPAGVSVMAGARGPPVSQCWTMGSARPTRAGLRRGMGRRQHRRQAGASEPLTTLAVSGRHHDPREAGDGRPLLPALRHPVVLAHQIANVDQISQGRVVWGSAWAEPAVGEREWAAVAAPTTSGASTPGRARRDLADPLARRAGDPPPRRRGADRSHSMVRCRGIRPGRRFSSRRRTAGENARPRSSTASAGLGDGIIHECTSTPRNAGSCAARARPKPLGPVRPRRRRGFELCVYNDRPRMARRSRRTRGPALSPRRVPARGLRRAGVHTRGGRWGSVPPTP